MICELHSYSHSLTRLFVKVHCKANALQKCHRACSFEIKTNIYGTLLGFRKFNVLSEFKFIFRLCSDGRPSNAIKSKSVREWRNSVIIYAAQRVFVSLHLRKCSRPIFKAANIIGQNEGKGEVSAPINPI